jgi:hypothetical protein
MHAVASLGASVSLERNLCDVTSSTINLLPSLAVAGGPTNRATVIDALPSNAIRLARLTIAPQVEPLPGVTLATGTVPPRIPAMQAVSRMAILYRRASRSTISYRTGVAWLSAD